ncbi:MAG: (d)CMP kinase [Oscillospiraceae bacterium]|jgi:cytidylate kinase|nr:(d)CMP kinase [Oscillospiraceae bacterium]
MQKNFIVAIDGPSGAGKSTIARRLAAHLGGVYVDTGALYRAVAVYIKQRGVSPENEAEIARCLSAAPPAIELRQGADGQCVFLNGIEVTREIRLPELSTLTSKIAQSSAVRAFLLDAQRQAARSAPFAVLDGRDIGTVVLPDAPVKIFLTASAEARAERRTAELLAQGVSVRYEDILRDNIARDKRDAVRTTAAPGAYIVDTSALSFDESFDKILDEVLRVREKE